MGKILTSMDTSGGTCLALQLVLSHRLHALQRVLHGMLTWYVCWLSGGGEPLWYSILSAGTGSFIHPGPQQCTGVVHCTESNWSPCPSFQHYCSATAEQTDECIRMTGSSCEQSSKGKERLSCSSGAGPHSATPGSLWHLSLSALTVH